MKYEKIHINNKNIDLINKKYKNYKNIEGILIISNNSSNYVLWINEYIIDISSVSKEISTLLLNDAILYGKIIGAKLKTTNISGIEDLLNYGFIEISKNDNNIILSYGTIHISEKSSSCKTKYNTLNEALSSSNQNDIFLVYHSIDNINYYPIYKIKKTKTKYRILEKIWNINSNGQLFESLKTARKKYENIFSKETIDELSQLDPSKTYKYTEKICELYKYGISKKEISNIIQDYSKYESSMDNPDITHKTYNEIVSDITIAKYISEHSIKKNKEEEKKRNLIYNNKNVYIYKINNFYDAYIKGKGTHWCIALSEQWYMIHKYRQEDFLFIYNKNLPEDNPNSKLCLTIFLTKGKCEITNKNNETYKEGADEEINCLNELGVNTLNFIYNYIDETYNK